MAEAQKGQEKVKDSPQGESSSPPLVGNTDTRISNHRKCWIYSPDVTKLSEDITNIVLNAIKDDPTDINLDETVAKKIEEKLLDWWQKENA